MPNLSRYSLEALGLFDRVQVAALDVLDQRRLEDLLIVEGDDVNRHLGQPRGLGRAQPPFAGDELVALADLAARPAVEARRAS